MDQELHRGLLLIFLTKVSGIIKEMDQELHRRLGLYSLLKVCGISKEMDQELNRGPLLILLMRSEWNQ